MRFYLLEDCKDVRVSKMATNGFLGDLEMDTYYLVSR